MSLAIELARCIDPSILMTDLGLVPDGWQASLLRNHAKRALICCCRQAGKSTVAAIMALHEALFSPPALILLLSPSLRQSGELLRKVSNFYQALGRPVPPNQESALRLELQNGSRIISLPGKELTVRGYSGVTLLVVDESARVPDELYFSIRPMLAVSQGRLVCLSTPFGRRGFFFTEWAEGFGWERFQVTAEQCCRISPAFLAEERASLGEHWFEQEYMCQFLDPIDNIFSHDLVMQAVTPTVQPLLLGGVR
jgi:hypothetical protein